MEGPAPSGPFRESKPSDGSCWTPLSDPRPDGAGPSMKTESLIDSGKMPQSLLRDFIFAQAAGHILQFTGSYVSLFVFCGFAYLIALGVLSILAPGLRPAEM